MKYELITELPGEYHERDEKTVYGQVTHMYRDYGLIDNYIYFTRECVKCVGNLEVILLNKTILLKY